MSKFTAFVFHCRQPPDTYNAKLLFNKFLQRGREFFEKVKYGSGRQSGTVHDVSVAPRVTPVVAPKARSAVYWEKTAAAWKSLVSSYVARNPSQGFVAKFAKSYQSQWVFGTWRRTAGYRGLARKIAMFGFVGVTISANGMSRAHDVYGLGDDNIYSAVHDMFAVKSKELCSGQSVSISCVDNLHEADLITSDGSGVDFTAEVGPHNEPEQYHSIESLLLPVDVEIVTNQHQQLKELIDSVQAQNTQLRTLVPFQPAANDDGLISCFDDSDLPTPACIDLSPNMDEALALIERCISEQGRRLTDITQAACHLNAVLKAACSQLQPPSEISATDAEAKTFNADVSDDIDDSDDEGFVVIPCDDEDAWCEVTNRDDAFTTMINFANNRRETHADIDQQQAELTQLPEDKTSVVIAKEEMIGSRDKPVNVMARDGTTRLESSPTSSGSNVMINYRMSNVDVIWWSHPTKPPDFH